MRASTPQGSTLRVLVATAELRPLVSAGGLGEAVAGLAAALSSHGVDVITALPAYQQFPLNDATDIELVVPDWAGPASARIGDHPTAGKVALIAVPGIERPDPYVDADGVGWADNMDRFAAFSAAVAALAEAITVDIVQLNDWHTALAPAFMSGDIPTVFTIHNLGHQGGAGPEWLERLPERADHYQWGDGMNALAGAIRLADRVVTVSPNYANEVLTEADGMGLNELLVARGNDLIGIRNGIDTRTWDPSIDAHIPTYSADDLAGKQQARAQLLDYVGWQDTGDPLVSMVTRLVEQKGVDLAFEGARFLEGMRCRMIVLGSGERRLADWGRWLMGEQPERFWFYDGFDAPFSHLLLGGSDLLLMPSRFEPCGLAQMQAMAYGTIPVVTGVGGLVDTVIDADMSKSGNGFVASQLDEPGVVDAWHRSLRAVRHAGRRKSIQRRGMNTDWSWTAPAAEFVTLYNSMLSAT